MGSEKLTTNRIIEEVLGSLSVDLTGTVRGIYRVYGEAKAITRIDLFFACHMVPNNLNLSF